MNPDDDDRELLSAAGAARRRAILADALRVADRRRRRRLAARAGATVCVVGLAVTTFVMLQRRGGSGRPVAPDRLAVEPASSRPVPPRETASVPRPMVVVETIHPNDVEPRWETLNDDQFLAALADAGKPSGFVRLNGRSMIVPVQ